MAISELSILLLLALFSVSMCSVIYKRGNYYIEKSRVLFLASTCYESGVFNYGSYEFKVDKRDGGIGIKGSEEGLAYLSGKINIPIKCNEILVPIKEN